MFDLRIVSKVRCVARLALVTGILILLLPALARPLQAQEVPGQDVIAIADTAALQAAIASDLSGKVLELAPGRYDEWVRLPLGTAGMVIRSVDPANPAILTGFLAEEFDGLIIENIVFSYTYNPRHDISIRPFLFSSGRDLTLRNLQVLGDVARDRDEFSDGLGFGVGLTLRGISGLVVTGSHISRFYRGLVVSGSSDVRITNNELVAMRMDGMNFVSVRRVWIEGNLIRDFDRSRDPADHADMIQFWTNGTARPSEDVFIRHNVLNSGDGDRTQTIFMRNDMVDRGLAGEEMFYRNITIENNLILNAHLHGITVGETMGLTIRNNTIVQNLITAGHNPASDVRIPRINLAPTSRQVTVQGNITAGITGVSGDSDWRVTDNLLVQNQSLMQPNHYTQVFIGFPQGDPTAADSYRPRPGGPAMGRGALWLVP